MPKNEEGEFELILGNRQLLSVFFIVVILLGVFFTMGFIIGKNSGVGETEIAARKEPGKPMVVDMGRTGDGAPVVTSTASPTVTPPPVTAPVQTAPQKADPPPARIERPEPVKVEAKKVEPEKPSPTKTEPAPAPRSTSGQPAPGIYLQLAATSFPMIKI